VNYWLKNTHTALFMEMRLGKVLTTIRGAQCRNLGPCLILAPKNVLEAWESDLEEEGETFVRAYDLSKAKREAAVLSAFAYQRSRVWVLINYEAVVASGEPYTRNVRGKLRRYRQPPDMAFLPWDLVVIDESTKIRIPTAQITKMCLEGFRYAKHRSILSGLPSPESYLDVFCQMCFLYGNFLGFNSYYKFRETLFTLSWKGWMPKPGVKDRIRKELHRLGYVMTRSQAGYKTKKEYERRFISMSSRQRKAYKEVEKDYAITLQSGVVRETSWTVSRRSWMRKLAGGFDPENALINSAKADEVLHIFKDLHPETRGVVWCHYRHEVDYVYQRLLKAGISATFIKGGMKQSERTARIRMLRDGTVRVVVATAEVAKFGNDYSAADVAVYYSNSEQGETRAQSEDRIISLQKTHPVTIIDLLTRDSVDLDILELVKDKNITAKSLLRRLDDALLKRVVKRA
jgi:rhodanese-related sulfurtransferase